MELGQICSFKEPGAGPRGQWPSFLERKAKVLRNKEVPLVKVQWQNQRGSEWTWELEAEMREHYLELFTTADFEDEVQFKWGENCNTPNLRYKLYNLIFILKGLLDELDALTRQWKDNLKPTTGRLVGFTGHNLWPLGTIHLPLTLTSHDKQRKKTAVVDFVVIWHSTKHNIILRRTTLLKLGAVLSTMHIIVKFSTTKGPTTILATPPRELQYFTVMQPTKITRETKKARAESTNEKEVINEEYPDQPINIGRGLTGHTRHALIDLLRRYKHMFAWTPTNMVGVDRKVIEHKLMIKPGTKEIKQKKRVQGGDRNMAINAEVAKLMQEGILQEAVFPTWIANPVMVRKHDGSWHMCIDFSDLNKACTKDCYPLPEIDQKVDSLQGFKLKCFLDAYKGYHQIMMSKEDQEKTTFYTDHDTFCYTKMPFGLKNTGETYQRLVDSIFSNKIGRNIEVYVDNMVIKSPDEAKMLGDVEQTFRKLEKEKMKLNPGKCTFGVEEGQFLGYYVTRQGIPPSPVNVDEFMETPPPNTLRDAQGLNGKLTALCRYISKSTDKAMPLFHTLKGCIEKSNFQWTAAVESALQKIKEALHKLPTLASPILGETLQVYLSNSNEAISSVLDVEREGEQKPVYFVSRALQGPELNYPTLEKLIEVLMNCSIKQILLKPETSGRLAKWAIELGEHDISYHPRMSIKGQALADFLLEIPGGGDATKEGIMVVKGIPENNRKWMLYTDGTSSREGSGACLILTSPEGEEVTYALRFDFHTSNNETEYEALLVGLRLAKQMGAEVVAALTDSRLAANQINGSFETRDKRMERYVKIEFTIKQIPRSENRRADALSKLASTCFDQLSKKVLVEVLKERSIDEQKVSILTTAGPTWMTPLVEYLQQGVLPDNHDEARKIRIKAP
uniref:RNase H type-1 domain-containing protein n=1 Tax=Lactuca sativa TaxID=4236 RepID=A0A9R1XIL6_LACSA|nr:hypothetical protein LSAT_V11C300153800 [Lactuca sativa]